MDRKYYFAARYSRNPELRGYRDQLVAIIPGAVVTSRWIDCHEDIVGGLEQSFTPDALNADPAGCWKFGQHDLEDLAAAHAIVSFTGDGGGGKGGRHIEHGVAIAYVDSPTPIGQFRLIVVGPRENIFHCHPATEVYESWGNFLEHESHTALVPPSYDPTFARALGTRAAAAIDLADEIDPPMEGGADG